MNRDFDSITVKEFHFLIKEYGCRLVDKKSFNYGYRLTYRNETTAVIIDYEYQEGYLFILLYRLVDGELREDPFHIDDDSQLNGFCLDDIIQIRSPKDVMKSIYKYDAESEYHNKINGFVLYVRKFADNLRKYGEDVLKGDFSLWSRLEKVVKKRACDFRCQ